VLFDKFLQAHWRLASDFLDHFICARENASRVIFRHFNEMLRNERIPPLYHLFVVRFKRYSFVLDLTSQDLRNLLEGLGVGVLFGTKQLVYFPCMR
jgi:hypothetical protein